MFQRFLLALGLWLSLICGVAKAATADADGSSGSAAEINRFLSETFRPDAPGAAVLVVHRGEVLLRKGYGLANLELGVPIDPAQVFRIGSLTKQFTAVAILQLVEAGKIRLEDEIGKYMPDYPASASKVTLAQLLTHTAGIASIETQPEWLKAWRQDLTVAELLAFTKDKPLDFAPGTNWKYSNSGYFLLGAVIEKASGQSYADYIQTRIFKPAGMASSCYGGEKRVIPGRVPGYSRDGKEWVNSPYISMTQPFSAGALLSTIDDLWKWEQALSAGKLVSTALLDQAYSQVQLPDGRGTNYGFGWQLGTVGTHRTVEHGGGIQGFSSYALRIVDAGFYVVILCNTDSPSVSPHSVAMRIARLALGEAEPTAPKAVPDLVLQDYSGVYRVGEKVTLAIVVENGKLVGQLGGGRRPLEAIANDEFGTPGNEMTLAFLRNAANHVDRVLVRSEGPGPGQIWPRVKQSE